MKFILLLALLSLTGCLKSCQKSFQEKSSDSTVEMGSSELLTLANPRGNEGVNIYEPDFVFKFPEGNAYGFVLFIKNKGNPFFTFNYWRDGTKQESEEIKSIPAPFNDNEFDLKNLESHKGRGYGWEYMAVASQYFTDKIHAQTKNGKIAWWNNLQGLEDFEVRNSEPDRDSNGNVIIENDLPKYSYTTKTGHFVFVVIPGSLLPSFSDSHTNAPKYSALELFNKIYNPETKLTETYSGTKIYLTKNRVKDILVIGDSVIWGQGLNEENKYSNKFALAMLKKKGISSRIYRYAHSGAIAQVNESKCATARPSFNVVHGEIPLKEHPHKRIGCQIEEFKSTPGVPNIDVILMNGGANDLGLIDSFISYILMPLRMADIPTDAVIKKTVEGLLNKIKNDTTFDNAKIIYTSYYNPFSSDSTYTILPLPGAVVAKGDSYHQAMDRSLQNAVTSIFAPTRAGLAKITVGLRHGMNASQAFVWPYSPLGPNDEVLVMRKNTCKQLDEDCEDAGELHPNVAGAQEYADSVYSQARNLGVIPSGPDLPPESRATKIKHILETEPGKVLMLKTDSFETAI